MGLKIISAQVSLQIKPDENFETGALNQSCTAHVLEYPNGFLKHFPGEPGMALPFAQFPKIYISNMLQCC